MRPKLWFCVRARELFRKGAALTQGAAEAGGARGAAVSEGHSGLALALGHPPLALQIPG